MELSRSGILATVVVLVVVVVCVRLGFWQLDRRAQRIESNAAIAERLAADPLTLTAPPPDTTGLLHRPATARGEFDHDRSIVQAGRSFLGAPGVYVFTPLRLAGGAILVNRGWLPAADAATVDLSMIRRVVADEVSGVLLPFPDVPAADREPGFHTRWFRLDGAGIRAQYPYEVAPVYLLETGPRPTAARTARSGGTGTVDPMPLDPPALDAGPHLSYAVQWFSFAAIFLIGWTTLVLTGGPGRARSGG